MSQISGFNVRELFHNTPHSPIELSIRVNYQAKDKSKPKEYVKTLKWNNENNELFITGVSDKLQELDSITSKLLSAENDTDNGITAFGSDLRHCL